MGHGGGMEWEVAKQPQIQVQVALGVVPDEPSGPKKYLTIALRSDPYFYSVPSMELIVSAMTLHNQQNLLWRSRPIHLACIGTVHRYCMGVHTH